MGGKLIRNGRVWFVNDSCGLFCVALTYFLILYGDFVVSFVLLRPSQFPLYATINGAIFQFCVTMAVVSHLKAMFTDPGVVPKGTATQEYIQSLGLKPGQVVLKCTKCCSIKPDRAHHCSVCQRCVRKMDHHCPWVNNCVGENNQKYFVLFNLYVACISVHSLVLLLFTFVSCVRSEWAVCTDWNPPATAVFLATLAIEGILFSLFTIIMCSNQLCSICEDETGIEKLKGETWRPEGDGRLDGVRKVFGKSVSIRWLSPFHHPSDRYRKYHTYYV